MRIDEVVKLHDILDEDQYIRLLRNLKSKADSGINVTRIKNSVIQSWKKGLKSRIHFDSLLSKIDLSIHDLID